MKKTLLSGSILKIVAHFLNNIAIVASATAPIFAKATTSQCLCIGEEERQWKRGRPAATFGPMGLRPNSLSLVVADANTSTPPRFAIRRESLIGDCYAI